RSGGRAIQTGDCGRRRGRPWVGLPGVGRGPWVPGPRRWGLPAGPRPASVGLSHDAAPLAASRRQIVLVLRSPNDSGGLWDPDRSGVKISRTSMRAGAWNASNPPSLPGVRPMPRRWQPLSLVGLAFFALVLGRLYVVGTDPDGRLRSRMMDEAPRLLAAL